MKFSVVERVMLSSLLPQEGTFANLKLLRVVKEELSFDVIENKILNFRQEGDQLFWDPDGTIKIADKEIEITSVVCKIVEDKLAELNSKAKLTEQHFTLYEKFIADDQSEPLKSVK